MVCNDIKTEISHVGDFGEESYTAQIEYTEPLVRFHIEEFLKEIQVNISKGKSTTVLCFESSPNVDMSKSMPFINELKKILQGAKNIEERYSKSESYEKFLNAFIERNEIISTIKEIEFVTYKASNLYPDFMKLTFRNPHFKKIELKNCYFYITFDWDESDELNLMDKFYSKSMDEKYKNKEKKDYYDGIRIDNKDFKDQI